MLVHLLTGKEQGTEKYVGLEQTSPSSTQPINVLSYTKGKTQLSSSCWENYYEINSIPT